MEGYYRDAVASGIGDVDRGIQTRQQYVRLVLQRPQAVTAYRGDYDDDPDTLIEKLDYIDGTYTPSPVSNTNMVVIGFAFGQLVDTTEINLYSTEPIDPDESKWEVATSSNALESQFSLAAFKATNLGVAQTSLNDAETGGNGIQYRYRLMFTLPEIEGLQYWRIKHETAQVFNYITEVDILEPLIPTITYFNTNGDLASSEYFEQENILDACFDPNNNPPNGQYFTIRFNDSLVGTTTLSLGDDFGDGDAGTASGTGAFNSARWIEDFTNDLFLRTGGELSYNVAGGKGQLETTYTFASPEADFDVEIGVTPITVTTEAMWFAMRALDIDNKAIMSEGMGIETSPTQSGVYFASYIDNFTSSAPTATMRDLRAQWHTVASGTDSFAMVFAGGSTWSVSGTQTGPLANATTGVLYDQTTATGTPIEFLISATSTPSIGQQFTFDLVSDNAKKDASAAGTIGIARSGSNWTTDNVVTSPVALGTDAVSIELFGNTDGTVNISADDYVVTTGSGTFGDIPSLTYNDFLDGRVQIACTSSGDSTAGFIYIKVNNILYKYPNDTITSLDDGSGATQTSTAQIAQDGTKSLQWTRESGADAAAPTPFLTYLEYEAGLDMLHLRTIDIENLQDTTDNREVLLDISDYNVSPYTVFYKQDDYDTLYYVDSSFLLRVFNVDDRISAFMAVNANDATLPAGTAQQTDVHADVINAWGEYLNGKEVTFSVTGDGAVTPPTDTTTGTGRATTQFTVGASVGVSTVTATVTETG
jgi:hypothetical protein